MNNTIFHVLFGGRDYYFGSIAAIFDVLTREQIRVGRDRLYAFGIKPGRPYSNAVCEIRRGELIRHKTNRKPPK